MMKVSASTISNDSILLPSAAPWPDDAIYLPLIAGYQGCVIQLTVHGVPFNRSHQMFVIGIVQWKTYQLLARMSAW